MEPLISYKGHFGLSNSSHFRYKEALLFELIVHDIKETGLVLFFNASCSRCFLSHRDLLFWPAEWRLDLK